ncbi:MAG: hypothetical protein HZA50_08860 [Planctomycetes bacterium]|nr:hypothetical protein [Planctomycetota bacterium]
MPYRMIGFWLGLIGAVVVVVLIVLGVNLRRSAATGPAWKRRLIVAGLAVLSMLGGYGGAAENAGPASTPATQNAPKELTDTAEWKQILEAYQEYGKLLKAGEFTQAQRKKVIGLQIKAEFATEQLVQTSLLSNAEKDILKSGLNGLRNQLSRKCRLTDPGPSEFVPVETCYKMSRIPSAEEKLLNKRHYNLVQCLPMLEKFAATEKIRSTTLELVVKTLIADIEVDIAALENLDPIVDSTEKKNMTDLRDKATKLLETIKTKGKTSATQPAAASQPAGPGTSNK